MFWDLILDAAAKLGIAVAAIAALLFFTRTLLPSWREQWLRSKSAGWPTIQATVDHACVTEYRPSDTRITYRLDAWFNYTVNGKIHDGAYMREDMRLDDAKRLLQKLNKEPVMITYNPKRPAQYFYEPVPPEDLLEEE